MIVVVDASVLVAELLRRRGRELLARPDLQCLVAEDQWDEAQHELDKRVASIVGQGRPDERPGPAAAEDRARLRGGRSDRRRAAQVLRAYGERRPPACATRSRRLGTGRASPRPRRRDPDCRQRLSWLRLSDLDGRDPPGGAGSTLISREANHLDDYRHMLQTCAGTALGQCLMQSP